MMPANIQESGIMLSWIEWCTVLCLENSKQYVANAKDLETESRGFVTDEDLTPGALVVWRHRGTPYTTEVVKVHGKY